jgi:hypothetical protein
LAGSGVALSGSFGFVVGREPAVIERAGQADDVPLLRPKDLLPHGGAVTVTLYAAVSAQESGASLERGGKAERYLTFDQDLNRFGVSR